MADPVQLGFTPRFQQYRNAWRASIERNPNSFIEIRNAAANISRRLSAAHSAWDMTAKGNLIAVPLIAFSVANTAPGERLATLAGETASLATTIPMAMALAALLPSVPVLVTTAAAGFASTWFAEHVNRAFSRLSKTERRVKRLEMGGNYQDTETAAQFRMSAAMDMSSAFQGRRTWLGREAWTLR